MKNLISQREFARKLFLRSPGGINCGICKRKSSFAREKIKFCLLSFVVANKATLEKSICSGKLNSRLDLIRTDLFFCQKILFNATKNSKASRLLGSLSAEKSSRLLSNQMLKFEISKKLFMRRKRSARTVAVFQITSARWLVRQYWSADCPQNRSDSLFMFRKKEITGAESVPVCNYQRPLGK